MADITVPYIILEKFKWRLHDRYIVHIKSQKRRRTKYDIKRISRAVAKAIKANKEERQDLQMR